jgi:Secretion system C-terminal sorting domain
MSRNSTDYIKKYFVLFIVTIFFIRNPSTAQIISYPVTAESITRGLDTTLLTVRIDFPVCTNPFVRIDLGATNTPGVIEYIPSSITKLGGTATLNITESNISNLQAPQFSVNSTTAGEYIIFSIKRRANCGVAAATKDNILVSGSCDFKELDPNINTYNLLAPALTLIAPPALSNVNLTSSYNRNITVTNGGNGCLDTLGFWIKHNTGEAILNSLKIGAITISPIFQNADSTYFLISGTTLSSDKLFCNGESIVLTENFTPLKCNAITTYGDAWYSHYNLICESDIATSGITMNNNVPNLVASIPAANRFDYCFKGESKIQTIRIVNTGTGPASNIELSLRNHVPGSFTGLNYFDTTAVWNVKNKNGVIIGSVSNFTNLYIAYPYNATCVQTAILNEGKGKLSSNIILAGADTLYIEVVTKTVNLGCSALACTYDAIGHVGIQTQLSYKNQCGSGSYVENYKTVLARNYTYFQYTVENVSDIDGYGVNSNFTLNFYFSSFNTMNHPSGNGTTRLAIPLLGTSLSPAVSTVTFNSWSLPVYVVNDTMFVGPFPQNVPYIYGSLTIPMQATCGTAGLKDINAFFLNQYDACSPVLKMSCRQSTIFVHCPTPCVDGGATPVSFNLRRINYGGVDNNNDGKPDASGSINLALIKDHRSVNGDTLEGKWAIKIFSNNNILDPNNGVDFNYVYVDFELGINGIGQPGTVNGLPNSKAEVWRSGSNIGNLIVSPTIIGTKAHYEYSAATLPLGVWQTGDSIAIVANYTVNQYNCDRYGKSNQAGFDLFITKNIVYSTYTQKLTPQSAPVTNETYTCDKYNDYNQMSRIWISPWMYAGQVINGCNNSIEAGIRQYTRNQEGGAIFPYEYRNFFIPDTMKVQVPSGVSYRANSAYFSVPANAIANANVYQVVDTLYFINLKNFYTPYGGTIVPLDETEDKYIHFSVDRNCNTMPGTYVASTNTMGIGNGVNTPSTNYQYIYPLTQTLGYIYNAPQPVLSGGGTVISSNGSANWNVVLQNISNNTSASFTYFYLTPTNGITNIVVKEGATIITPDANGFYQLGNLNASATRIFTITGDAKNCFKDSMKVNQGWGCNSYPIVFNPQICNQTTWLKVENYQSQIQLTVTKQPTIPNIPLCNNETVEFVMNSAQAAFADNPVFIVTPPTGLNITSGEIEYPLGSGNWQTITPVIGGGLYTYVIEDHTQLQTLWNNKGLPGTLDYAGIDQRQVKLRINFSTTCDFTSGAKMTVQQRADKPCGNTIPISLGYNNIVRTDPINITGAGGVGAMSFNLTLNPNTINCGIVNIGGSVTPIGASTTASDTVVVTLPAAVTYSGSFVGAPNASYISSTLGAGGTTILKIKIADGITPGTVIPYSFNVIPNVNSGCGNFTIVSESERSFTPLSCGVTLCPNTPKVIIGSANNTITVDRPDIQIANFSLLSGNFAPNNTIGVNVIVSNVSTTAAAPANSMLVEFFCGSNVTPFAVQPFPNAIPANGSSNVNMTISIPNTPMCNIGDGIKMVIRPSALSCVCEPTSTPLPGLFLPIVYKNFTAERVNNTSLLKFEIEQAVVNTNFIIERSADGINFNSIGTLTSTATTNYSYIDMNPILSANNHYRIKVINTQGGVAYSEVKLVKFAKKDKIEIYPVPANSNLNIVLSEALVKKPIAIALYNTQGQEVLKTNINRAAPTELINISKLSAGVYHLKISTDNKVVTDRSIIIAD